MSTAEQLLTVLAARHLVRHAGIDVATAARLQCDAAVREAESRHGAQAAALELDDSRRGGRSFLLEWFATFWDVFAGFDARGETLRPGPRLQGGAAAPGATGPFKSSDAMFNPRW